MLSLFLCFLTNLSCSPTSWAQQPVLETPEQTNERLRAISAAAAKAPHDYLIGNGDLLSVEVFDVKELTRETRVSPTGTVSLPLIPVRLHVAGLTEIQAEQKIAEVLEANGLVSHPQVSVSVKEKKSKPIMVMGAVQHPSVYQAERPMTLIEVLSLAGGIANDAGNVVIVTRGVLAPAPGSPTEASGAPAAEGAASSPAAEPKAAAANQRRGDALILASEEIGRNSPAAKPEEPLAPPQPVITINLNDLLESGDPKNNLVLEGGDMVTVPHAGIVYVIGAVGHPGGFVLANDRSQMSTLKILSLAGGLRGTAKADSAVILRKDATGQQREVVVHLKKILARKDEDVLLLPSDILFVPESGGKRTAIRLAEIALGIGSAVTIFRVAH